MKFEPVSYTGLLFFSWFPLFTIHVNQGQTGGGQKNTWKQDRTDGVCYTSNVRSLLNSRATVLPEITVVKTDYLSQKLSNQSDSQLKSI